MGAFTLQWIEIDLEANYVIGGSKLLPSQSPTGKIVHRLLIKGPVTNDQYELLHTFEGITSDSRWLSYRPDESIRGIRYIRVEKVSSPSWVSWRELEVISGK